MNIGNAIRLCRLKRKLSLAELARRTECSISYLSMLETGERVDPVLSKLTRIAEALRVPIEILFFLAADRGQLAGLDKGLAGQLAIAALDLLDEPEPKQADLPI